MDKDMAQIPFMAHEYSISRMERMNKRLVTALIISIILLFLSNCMWLYAWMQYDYSSNAATTETVTVDGKDGIANYIGNDGDISNGTNNSAESDNTNTDKSADKGE